VIVVEVELHPGGNPRSAWGGVTALLVIWNDRTGTDTVGNYRYAALTPRSRRASQEPRPRDWAVHVGAGIDPDGWAVHRGRVEGVPRTDSANLNVVAAGHPRPAMTEYERGAG